MSEKLVLPLVLLILGQLQISVEQNSHPDLHPLLKKSLDEFLAGKYLQALVDAFRFSSKQGAWNPLDALKYLLLKNSTLNVEHITTILRDYQTRLMSEPKQLISELLTLDSQQFLVAMKLLFRGRKEQTPLMDIDFDLIKAALVQSPGGNRSLFRIAKERCWHELNAPDCVELLGGAMRLSSGEFVQEELITELPRDLQDDTFRNITAVFKDLYDKFSVSTQRAIYKWITLGLQKATKSNAGGFDSWITAESLRFLGRYIVHLPVYNIRTIPIRMFINYDNATKQLDSVYDIKPATAKAFLGSINGSGFDMRNTSIVYRLGLLVCFYNNVHQLGASDARNLLHQLIKCHQLRGSQSDVQKLKSQLLEIVMKNQTLNETLGSVSDALVGLTPSQLESLSPEAVQGSIAVLQQVLGWTRSQTIILAHKYVGSSKVLSFSNISQLGSLISGVDTNLFYSISTEELGKALESTLSQYASDLNPAQQHAIVSQMITAPELWAVMKQLPSVLFAEVSLSTLLELQSIETSTVGEKQLTRSQANFLYDTFSKRMSTTDLISTGQLVKGISCDQIHEMDNKAFMTNFTLFEKNLHLLSPFQMNCLAWKYWKVLNTTNPSIPPILLSVLPVEYIYNMPSSWCKPFLVSLGRIDLDLLVLYAEKQEAVIKKVLQCLTDGIQDEYDVDMLGQLICHLPPETILTKISQTALTATLRQFKTCRDLSQEQKVAVKSKLAELYGNCTDWTAELTQDLGPLVTLLSKDEITAIANKFLDELLPLAVKVAGGSLPEEFLSALFDAVRGSGVRDQAVDKGPDCDAVRAPTADDIKKLSEANSYWSVLELQCMSDDTFTRTVELLGSVEGYNMSQLRALKNKAKQVWGPLSSWKSYHVISLGAIGLALTESEIKELDLSSIDTMTALSQQSTWTAGQMNSLLTRFLEASGLSLGALKGSDLAGLGIILCGVDPSQIQLISSAAYSATTARIGTLPCPAEVLQELKKKAESVFGEVGNWNSSVLQEVGTIAAGLSKEELKAISKDLMPYFQPQAIAAILPENFKEFSVEQIQSLGPENAAAVTPLQIAELSREQIQSLQASLDGLRESYASWGSLGSSTVNTGASLHHSAHLWFWVVCVAGSWIIPRREL
ncbi:otoancorin-like isoform X2 [Polyodon spathula]|uniref:otoancorin-like isoform X2 n=1 Tax=Polyodon spathula TaxID=7913 RepID=UPI001B7E250B|nr:otoancorin-like isoform X2 [Polyodon spathula]